MYYVDIVFHLQVENVLQNVFSDIKISLGQPGLGVRKVKSRTMLRNCCLESEAYYNQAGGLGKKFVNIVCGQFFLQFGPCPRHLDDSAIG